MESSIRAYLLSPRYDGFLVFCPVLLGAVACALSSVSEPFFYSVLALNLWFLGYHHVISTYTRMAFSVKDLKNHWFYVFVLPILVTAATITMFRWGGEWTIGTLYLYWQLYHYARQSEGIFKAMGSRYAREPCVGLRRVYFYAPVLSAFFSLSYLSHSTFLGLPIKVLNMPSELAALGTLLFLLISIIGVLDVALKGVNKGFTEFEFFYISHVFMFLSAYVLINRLDIGWMAINVWHNLQYITFVWLYNHKRYKGGVDKNARLLSTLAQKKNIILYFIVCLLITYVFYKYFVTKVFSAAISSWLIDGVGYIVVPYMIINFHHYIVDSQIWKLRSPKLRSRLGIS